MEELIDITQKQTNRKLRVLCFHGYYNNVEVISHQLDYYIEIFKDYVDFEFINGFYENSDIFDLALYRMFKDRKFYSWAINDEKTNKPKGFLNSLYHVIAYINKNGPYDGLLGFSQGTFLIRVLLKLDKFKTKFPVLKSIPNFGIIIGGPLRLSMNAFKDYPQDKYKLLSKYDQPMLYMYGIRDPFLDKIKFGIIEEGDYTVIQHSSGHNIPRLVNDQMDQFTGFLQKAYKSRFGVTMEITEIILQKLKDEAYLNLLRYNQSF